MLLLFLLTRAWLGECRVWDAHVLEYHNAAMVSVMPKCNDALDADAQLMK